MNYNFIISFIISLYFSRATLKILLLCGFLDINKGIVQMNTKHDRQIGIINYLAKVDRAIYTNIASFFGVSVKTVKQDISELSLYYPITTYQGRFGGVELDKCHQINGIVLNSKDIQIISSALECYKTYNPDIRIDQLIKLFTK